MGCWRAGGLLLQFLPQSPERARQAETQALGLFIEPLLQVLDQAARIAVGPHRERHEAERQRIDVAHPAIGAPARAVHENNGPARGARFDDARVDTSDALWIRNHPFSSGAA